MGLAGTCHQTAAEQAGVKFIAEWFADLDYSPEGKLIITKYASFRMAGIDARRAESGGLRKHDPVPLDEVRKRVCTKS
jgi:lactam utilization protein B